MPSRTSGTRQIALSRVTARNTVFVFSFSTSPFGLGTELGSSDASPHAFGLYITNALYQQYGGIPPTNIEALKIFFADGLEAVIHAHRDRVKLKIETHPPKEWIEFLEDQRDEQQEPPPNSEEPKS